MVKKYWYVKKAELHTQAEKQDEQNEKDDDEQEDIESTIE